MALEPAIGRSVVVDSQREDINAHDPARLEYNARIEELREAEYPMLKDQTYLDHAGTTPPPASLLAQFAQTLSCNLYGNPHSFGSASSQKTSSVVDNVRLKVLKLFNARPEDYDVIFVANATAGIKIVADAFSSQPGGFEYKYHRDSHTSIIGVRELATSSQCIERVTSLNQWLNDCQSKSKARTNLFAYPAQSNMNGRRLPLAWCEDVEQARAYSLLDAAALVSTSPLNLGPDSSQPHFVVMSFYKMFGFPDLGALFIRKDVGHLFSAKLYFGGGTVETVACEDEQQWHIKKANLHESLEDGTLPLHSIVALDIAIDNHRSLFGSFQTISEHTTFLAQVLYAQLRLLQHSNGQPVCEIYNQDPLLNGSWVAGPVIALNFRDAQGRFVSNSEVQKLANIRNIHLRTGNLCNPGGVSHALGMDAADLKDNYSAGVRCGGEQDVLHGRPTGVVRVSFGSMSSLRDMEAFLAFVKDFFVEETFINDQNQPAQARTGEEFIIDQLFVYPIKSCGGLQVPQGMPWTVTREGLALDREWCLIHQGTRSVLSQKRYPKLALFRPELNRNTSELVVRWIGDDRLNSRASISISLEDIDAQFSDVHHQMSNDCPSYLCGDRIDSRVYHSKHIHDFFSTYLDVPVYLARKQVSHQQISRAKQVELESNIPGSFPTPPPSPRSSGLQSRSRSSLANESPLLVMFLPSLDRINSLLPTAYSPIAKETFRANIVLRSGTPGLTIGQDLSSFRSAATPLSFVEDGLSNLQIFDSYGNKVELDLLAPCRRCQMVTIDQSTAQRRPEVFAHLAKHRRWDGGVWFGVHATLHNCHDKKKEMKLSVGDLVKAS